MLLFMKVNIIIIVNTVITIEQLNTTIQVGVILLFRHRSAPSLDMGVVRKIFEVTEDDKNKIEHYFSL